MGPDGAQHPQSPALLLVSVSACFHPVSFVFYFPRSTLCSLNPPSICRQRVHLDTRWAHPSPDLVLHPRVPTHTGSEKGPACRSSRTQLVPCLYQPKSQPQGLLFRKSSLLACCHSQKPEAAHLTRSPQAQIRSIRVAGTKSRRKETGQVVREQQVSSPGHSGGQKQCRLISVPCRAPAQSFPQMGVH